VNCWMNKTISLNDSWGPGANDVLRAPLGCAGEFSLRPRYLRDARGARQLAQFEAEFASGYMSDGWRAAVFTPVGTMPITGVFGLPPWDPTQAATYRNLIEGPTTNLGDSRTLRLEAVIPYTDPNGAVGYDTVRLFYAFNAIQGAESPDLVVLKTATLVGISGVVQVRQDGGGQGSRG
jgi:hypothetical protein